MRAALEAERRKLRRLRLPLVAASAGILVLLLLGLSLSGAASRIRTEQNMESPWQNGVIGDASVSMMLVLPALVTLLTALAFHVEHRSDMWKQLRMTPQPLLAVHAAKFLWIQALILLALGAALVGALVGWHLLPEVLKVEIGVADAGAYSVTGWTAALLYLSLLPVALVQFLLSARMPNVLHPVGIGLALTFASLMMFGPATAPYLPYAWPGAVVIGNFGEAPQPEMQQPDPDYRPPPGLLSGQRPARGAILFDEAHGNRHAPGGSLGWIARSAGEAGIAARSSDGPLTPETLAGVDLLIVGAASRPIAAAEAEAISAWVARGGALLLLTDHEPFASPAEPLAARLGVGMSRELVAGGPEGSARRDFRIVCPTSQRGAPVRVYGGQALWRQRGESLRLLPLDGPIRSEAGAIIQPPARAAQLLAFRHGAGRAIVSGDGGLFGAQLGGGGAVGVNDPATGNQAFAASVLRWLLGLSAHPPSLCLPDR